MTRERSDLHERLPLFEEFKDAIGDPTCKAYDYIDPTVVSMMQGCVPVGLRSDGAMAIPKSYEPQDGPPVLMLRPGEQVDIRWSDGMEKALGRVAQLARLNLATDINSPPITTSDGLAYLHTMSWNVSYPSHPDKTCEPITVPLYVGLRPQGLPANRRTSLLHECDHWDFYLNEAPDFSVPEATALPPRGKSTLAEKRAYTTNYVNAVNTGLAAYFMSAEQLQVYLGGLTPTEAGLRVRSILDQYRCPQSHMGTLAVALSLQFGDMNPGIPINKQEIEAYEAANLA